jgi:hypothetical protein
MGVNQQYFDKYTNPLQREIDRVNVYEFDSGMDYELTTIGGEINPENIKKAQAKVIKNLKADPAYYTNRLAADSVKLVGEWGSGKKPGTRNTAKSAEAVKAEVKTLKDDTLTKDKSNEMKVAKKDVKSNVRKDSKVKNPNNPGKVASMTQTPKKLRGAKVMAMPGKEKKVALKEGFHSVYETDEKPKKRILPNKQKGIEDKIEIKSALEKVIKKAWDEPNLETAKKIVTTFLNTSKINTKVKNNMLNKIQDITNKSKLDLYLANSLLAYEKLKINEQLDNLKNSMSETDEKRPSDKEVDAAWKKYQANKKTKGEPIINIGKTTSNNKKRIQNNEGVQVQDSRTIRLTPENVKTIKNMIREIVLKKANSKDTVIASNPNTINTLKSSGYQPISGTEDAK